MYFSSLCLAALVLCVSCSNVSSEYLCLKLDAQLLQLLVVFLSELLQSQFSLDTDGRTRDTVQ